jgi:thioredoxin reductase (NADPH)
MAEKMIIIGSGPAGLTAAIYAARASLNPLLFEGFQSGGMPGGQLMTTGVIENFPGFPQGIDGQQFMSQMREQAVRFGTQSVMEDIVEVDLSKRPFEAETMNGACYEACTLIIATGATARRLPLESEKQFWGKGISACAVCDGALPVFRNKELAVIGGGDSAVEEAIHLTQFGSKVYMIHRRDQLRASRIMQQRAMEHPKIEILWNKVIDEFSGKERLEGIRLKDTITKEISDLPCAGAFEAIGHIPNTGFLDKQIQTDETGYIITKPDSTATTIDGVFAAGDVQDKNFRQAITAAGSGCMAAIEAERWLQEEGMMCDQKAAAGNA